MKYLSEDRKNDLFIFAATKEELEVCSKVTHLALDWLGDEFDARNQNTYESPYETGLELDKKLATLVEEHKNAALTDIITVNIRFFEASIYLCLFQRSV
ncbi:hypothetical protein [Entomobacter blattae]|uniref:Uncharacterized protein n=1 Tax=Entomobacter blattae TaxID=2762277 RepID=A0A7H1NS75_9PROT|nr:hypothetical protein [Entomobacter blattae]QNT78635.1 hypothetical protein JGUZn3_14100 [Entomobacter blattae]